MNIVSDIDIYSFIITCRTTRPIYFPNFAGIALRGGFGHCLKKAVCVRGKEVKYCNECVLAESCAYAFIFETPNIAQADKMKKASNFPHPFTLTPLFDSPIKFKEGDTFDVRLVLFGNAIKYFPHSVHALTVLGIEGIGVKKGKFTIQAIHQPYSDIEIYDGAVIAVEKAVPLSIKEPADINALQIIFKTPCKIKQQGKYLRHVDLKAIVKNIKRRIENISYFFGRSPVILDADSIDYTRLITTANTVRWITNERYSKRRGERMVLSGFVGDATLTGNCTSVYPILKVGEAINIGSNTSFGYGAIVVEEVR
ncbi:MAG: CRISPR system precrRNA processing endoribonuclease RAMP protein Cas6 [Spirochaetota bacterium]